MINNIKKYRKAIIYTKELSVLSDILNTAIDQLEKYRKYIPAQECIEVLNNNKLLVDTHLNHQRKIVESKGAE